MNLNLDDRQKKLLRWMATYLITNILCIVLFQSMAVYSTLMQIEEIPYSEFRAQVANGKVKEVLLADSSIEGELQDGTRFNVVAVRDDGLVELLQENGVEYRAKPPSGFLTRLLVEWGIPLLMVGALWYFLMRRMGQAGANVMAFRQSRAKELQGQLTGITFANVGGIEEATQELQEIIQFLKEPEEFTKLGAKIPKGVLLVGPPGTGKTLLAKATAGEAEVPFFSLSGSDFVEMFVGVGAARVRDLFEQAKKRAPCIVFIDEIDAIGQRRSTVGSIGSNDEREQTLNQLLSQMDGFEGNQGVIIMAATNRPEILDPALLRPGRFDRQIQVDLPSQEGRAEILRIHSKEVKLADPADLRRVAQITSGFSGADLANIVNEAALLAVRRGGESVEMEDFERAIDRVVAGLQRKTHKLQEDERRKVAYHEGGHALVASLLPNTDPVHKVSIIPTSKGALGYTMQMPEEDRYLMGEAELKDRLAVMLGGRAAELLVCGEPSTGAANDLERATAIARRMVTEFGMSEKLGPVRYATEAGMGYLGATGGLQQGTSPEAAAAIDAEMRRIVEEAQECAKNVLRENAAALQEVARVLLEKEVISGERIKEIATRMKDEPVTEEELKQC